MKLELQLKSQPRKFMELEVHELSCTPMSLFCLSCVNSANKPSLSPHSMLSSLLGSREWWQMGQIKSRDSKSL